MNRSDLIKAMSQQVEVAPAEIERIVDALLATIVTALASGEAVVIKNFGRFETRERGPTVRRNPRSGIDVKVPRKKGILFHPAPAFKENIQREDTAYE